LWPQTTLILVSDHGMTVTSRRIDLAGKLQQQGIEARVFGDALAHVFVSDESRIPAAGELVQQVIDNECPNARLYARDQLPDEMRLRHPTRSGDWIVVAAPPCVFSQPSGLSGRIQMALDYLGWGFGSHGYDPDLPDMGGVFMAMGRGVDPDLVLGEVRQIDLAATVSGLLGIAPPADSEGVPIL
jgi:predicted AlkP superfamily pyrophosphatase or phosphodiesterase